MDNVVDRLYLWLGLDTKEVDKGLDAMEGKLSGSLKSITSNFIAPLAAALSAGALFGDYTARADALSKQAADMDVAIGDLHAWSEASARAGGSAEAFQGAVQSLNASLVQVAATGGGRAKAFLEELGIQAKSAAGGVRPVFEVLGELSDKFEQMSKAESMGFGRKLGLDSGTIHLLQGGRKNLDELIKRQKDLGVYTKRDGEVTELFNDTIDDMGQSLKALAAIIFRVVTPALTWIADTLTQGISILRKNEPFVLAFFAGIAAVVTATLLPAMKALAIAFLTNPAFWGWAAIVASVAAVALVIDDLYAYMSGGKSAFASFWSKFGTGEEIAAKLSRAWEVFKEILSAVWGAAVKIVDTLRDAFAPAVNSLVDVLGAALDGWIALFEGNFIQFGVIVVKQIGNIALFIMNVLKSAAIFVMAILVMAFETAFETVKAVWGALADWFYSKVIQPIADMLASVVSPLMDAWAKVTGFFSGGGSLPGGFAPATTGGVSPDRAAAGRGGDISTETNIGDVYVTTNATDAKGTGAAVQQGVAGAINAGNGGIIQVYEGGGD